MLLIFRGFWSVCWRLILMIGILFGLMDLIAIHACILPVHLTGSSAFRFKDYILFTSANEVRILALLQAHFALEVVTVVTLGSPPLGGVGLTWTMLSSVERLGEWIFACSLASGELRLRGALMWRLGQFLVGWRRCRKRLAAITVHVFWL